MASEKTFKYEKLQYHIQMHVQKSGSNFLVSYQITVWYAGEEFYSDAENQSNEK